MLWVPSCFFAMGTVYTMVTTASNIMFANLGLPNAQAAAYSSLTGLAYTFNPLWAPLLELYRTKRFFVLAAQSVLACAFAGVAIALGRPSFVDPVVALLMLASLAGATQDVATNGVYVTTLDETEEAAYAGVQSMTWSIGPILAASVLVLLVGRFSGETGRGARPTSAAYAHAWSLVGFGVAVLLAALVAWHAVVLPTGSKAGDAPASLRDAAAGLGRVFVTFFQKKDLIRLLAFAFFYRFGLGLLDKVGPLFLLDARAHGGLGLDNGQLGLLNGIATGAFIAGSFIGARFVAKRGLRRSILVLCLALNIPNVTFLYLGWARPESLWIIGSVFLLEKVGWGIGAVGHMLYMMQQIAPGPYKTAHFAFATGLGLSLCMTLTGLVSGRMQTLLGYQAFFVVVLVACVPSVLFTVLAPFHNADATPKTVTGH
jgi:PAT family beta-lactamase induction signal transducer AmpG